MDDPKENGATVDRPASEPRTNKYNPKESGKPDSEKTSSEGVQLEEPSDTEILEQEELGRKLLDEKTLVDADSVRSALAVLIEPGEVFEIRVLGAPKRGSGKGIISGYFDDIEACIAQLARLSKAAGVYVTLNSVDSALLSRRVNRLDYAQSGDTTGDQHILKRCWLLLDFDAERPSGISANDAEKEAARQKAREVCAFLKARGWPSPVASDSGNGFHLLYRIDLPANDTGLIERLLAGLAERFNGNGVKIDRTVHNPSRIARLYGTKACKGDSTPERPHRLSRLRNVPNEILAVTREQLEALAGMASAAGATAATATPARRERKRNVFNGSGWDMEAFLKKHSIAFHDDDVRTLSDGRKMWILKECPFNTDHGDHRETAVFVGTTGVLGFSCKHESCKGKHWHDFRRHYEPEKSAVSSYPRNDTDRGDRFALKFGADLRYIDGWKAWLRWDGTRWKRDEDGEVMRLAKEMPCIFLKEASEIKEEEARKRAAREAITAGDAGKLRAMMQLAGSHSQIAARAQMFDANPYLLSVRNGVIELRTGAFRDARKDDYLTKQAGASFDRGARCPKWIEHLRTVFAGNESLISFFQRAVGYSLTGDTKEQKLFFLYGTGNNGKSTTTETLQTLLGDYARAATSELFMLNKHGKEPQAEITRLLGARFVVGSEIEEGAKLAESRVKWLTGQDTLVGRFLYGEPFSFAPTHKLWIFGNHKPDVCGHDLGIWRRMCLLPFTVQIPNGMKDPQLPEKLRHELPGILNWALDGCAMWRKEGLRIPPIVSEATEEYRDEEDELGEFIDEECHTGAGVEVIKSTLHDRYRHWAADRGVKMPLRQKPFAKQLASRDGIKDRKSHGVRYWTGICLKPVRVSFA